MKKKLLALVISVMTVSMLVGCGSKEDTVATDNTEIEAIETTASSDDNAEVAEEEKEEATTEEEVTDTDTTEDIPEEVKLETETTPVVETAPVEVSAPAATSTTTTSSSSSGLTKAKVIKMIDDCCTPPDTLTGRYIIEPEGRYTFEVVPGLWVNTYYGYMYKDHVGGMQQRVPTIEYDKYPDGYYYAPRDYPEYDPNWTPDGAILTEPAIAF